MHVCSPPQAKIFDRDCKLRGEFARGDMYIRDMKNTKVRRVQSKKLLIYKAAKHTNDML